MDSPCASQGRECAHAQRPEGQQPGRRGEPGPSQDPRSVREVQVHRRAAVRGDELGSRTDTEGALGGDRQVPEDRCDRVGLRPLAGRCLARVHEERPEDSCSGDVRRERSGVLLEEERGKESDVQALHRVHAERPCSACDGLGDCPGHGWQEAGDDALPVACVRRLDDWKAESRASARRTCPATSISRPSCRPSRRRSS